MVWRVHGLAILALLTLGSSRSFAAEEGRGWGSSWTVPHSEQEKIGRDLADRLSKALRAKEWAAAAKVLDEAERANPKSAGLQVARATVAMVRHRYAEAAGYYDRALSLLPAQGQATAASFLHAERGYAHALAGEYRLARIDLERAIALNKNNLQAHNNYAWLLATCPDASVRDGKRAAEFARAANQRTGKRNPMILDTLAAAEAEAGDFRAAISDEKRAIALVKGNRDLYQQHLQSYVKSTPIRETPQPLDVPKS